MKYDDASWHYGGDFPADLPPKAGATHIAMFVVWCWANGLAGEDAIENEDALEAVRVRSATPGDIFIRTCDEKFIDADLTEDGNGFAVDYYRPPGQAQGTAYLSDYETVVGRGLPTLYHVSDDWQTYDALAPVIARRLNAWRRRQMPWWRRWLPPSNTK
ncbi:MAG: hypothetical protein JF615_10275 [Asticcacaulis sp.]|nr:hypothetical protein [Asticcacaulis sp.]